LETVIVAIDTASRTQLAAVPEVRQPVVRDESTEPVFRRGSRELPLGSIVCASTRS
jgi:hypothetical protein